MTYEALTFLTISVQHEDAKRQKRLVFSAVVRIAVGGQPQ